MTAHAPGKVALRAVDAAAPLRVDVPQRISDILAEKLPEDVVAGLLPRQGVAVLFGDANCGKTFLALDLAASVATGCDFAGRTVKQGAVLYIVGEGFGGFAKRLRALMQKHPNLPAAPLRVLRQAVNLREWCEDLLLRARDITEDDGDLGLVILDTLSQTIWGDENGKEMAEYVGAAGRLSNMLGCSVLILHHQGKNADRGMRGSSSLRGNVDIAIHLKASDSSSGNRTATTDPASGGKTRDDEPVTIGFRLQSVPVGRDADGRVITSCVVEHQAAPVTAPGPTRKAVTGAARRLLMELAGELARASTRYRGDGTPLVSRTDLEGAWAATKKATRQDKQAAPSYMSRPLIELASSGHLMRAGGDLWFPR